MAFCIHCGSEVASDATFCHSCGNAVQLEAAGGAPPPAQETAPLVETPSAPGWSATPESAPIDSGASWSAPAEGEAAPGAPADSSWGTPASEPTSADWSSTPAAPEVDSGSSSWGTADSGSSWGTADPGSGSSSWGTPDSGSSWGTPAASEPEPAPASPGTWTPSSASAAAGSSWTPPASSPPPATGWPPSLSSATPAAPPATVTPSTGVPNYLVPSIVTTVLSMACCCFPVGAISLIYAAQANSKGTLGLTEEALRNANLSRTWLIVAWVLMGLSLITWAGFFALSLMAGNL